jgi:hypothetical protein
MRAPSGRSDHHRHGLVQTRSPESAEGASMGGSLRKISNAMTHPGLYLLVAAFLLQTIPGHAQPATPAPAAASIAGRVLNAETDGPVVGVNVFLSYTMMGTLTDADGRYRIEGVPAASYELVVSLLGFEAQSVRIDIGPEDRSMTMDFRLKPVVYELPPVSVTGREDRTWRRHYGQFEELILGKTPNARETSILNPYVLDFKTHPVTAEFSATASEPLIIEHRALGYRVTFVLLEFRLDPHAQLLRYSGRPYFAPLAAEDEKEEARWAEIRSQTYHGSLQHLLAAAAQDRLHEEGFLLLKDYLHEDRGRQPHQAVHRELASNQIIDLKPVRWEEILWQTSRPHERELRFTNYLRVIYRGKVNRPRARFRRDRSPEEQISWILMNVPWAILYEDGYIFPASALTVHGYMANHRLAELLPREYSMMRASGL